MNYPIPAKTYSSASELLAEGKARRERLMSGRSALPAPVSRLAMPVASAADYYTEVLGSPVNMLAGPSWRFFVALMALKHGVSQKEIMGIRRSKHIVAARDEAMLLVYRHTQASLPQVGRWFGKDHTTVHHSLHKFPECSKLVEKPAPQSPRQLAPLPGRDKTGRFLRGKPPVAKKPKPRATKGKKPRTVLQRAVVRAYKHNVMPAIVAEEYDCSPKSVKVIACRMGLKRSDYRAKDKTDWAAQP